MNYNEIENEEVKQIIDEFTKIVGASYCSRSQVNGNHFGTVDWSMALKFMELAELRKMNDNLEHIGQMLIYLR